MRSRWTFHREKRRCTHHHYSVILYVFLTFPLSFFLIFYLLVLFLSVPRFPHSCFPYFTPLSHNAPLPNYHQHNSTPLHLHFTLPPLLFLIIFRKMSGTVLHQKYMISTTNLSCKILRYLNY